MEGASQMVMTRVTKVFDDRDVADAEKREVGK
jgi:hypothetical protein